MLSFILFFAITYGLGYSLTRFIKENSIEVAVMRVGIGLGGLPLLGVVLNIAGIPLDWKIILALTILLPMLDLARNKPKLTSYLKRHTKAYRFNANVIFLILLFAFCLYIYCAGSFSYFWLEDDDPWSHAASIKYIALEKNFHASPGQFHYLNPYPPGYDFVLAILHQVNPSIYWTLKFFNGFIIALGVLFFYFFVKKFLNSPTKARIATFILAMTPCYLSHFIWAHSLVVTLFFPAFYTLLRSQNNKRFYLPSTVVITGIFLTQPTQAIKFIIFVLLLILAIFISNRRVWKSSLICLGIAGIISLLWWGPVLKGYLIKSPQMTILMRTQAEFAGSTPSLGKLNLFSPHGGSATRAYSSKDYLFPAFDATTSINNPVGVGTLTCALTLIGLIFYIRLLIRKNSKPPQHALTVLFWFLFTFLGMNSSTFNLPVGLYAFRFWMLFAIPTAILATEGYSIINQCMKTSLSRKILPIIFIALIWVTAGHTKYKINTSAWHYGVYWSSLDELLNFVQLRDDLEPNTKIFTFMDNQLVIGLDMRADYWRPEYKKAFQNAIDLDPQTLHSRLKQQGFKYIVIGEKEYLKFGKIFVRNKLLALQQSGLFGARDIESNLVVLEILDR